MSLNVTTKPRPTVLTVYYDHSMVNTNCCMSRCILSDNLTCKPFETHSRRCVRSTIRGMWKNAYHMKLRLAHKCTSLKPSIENSVNPELLTHNGLHRTNVWYSYSQQYLINNSMSVSTKKLNILELISADLDKESWLFYPNMTRTVDVFMKLFCAAFLVHIWLLPIKMLSKKHCN